MSGANAQYWASRAGREEAQTHYRKEQALVNKVAQLRTSAEMELTGAHETRKSGDVEAQGAHLIRWASYWKSCQGHQVKLSRMRSQWTTRLKAATGPLPDGSSSGSRDSEEWLCPGWWARNGTA